jgi:hypothetical protein
MLRRHSALIAMAGEFLPIPCGYQEVRLREHRGVDAERGAHCPPESARPGLLDAGL